MTRSIGSSCVEEEAIVSEAADEHLSPHHTQHRSRTHHALPHIANNNRYGKMGYAFGRGSYNISQQQYAAAVARVRGAPLDSIAADFGWLQGEPMAQLLQHYTSRGGCDRHVGV